ncbi:carbamoyl-phosphate synthase large subunit [Salinibacter ruber]|uniref:Carbamoyl-phosphate synthase large subunit n=1 Tax=Salinibacter ruber TaxID=146919 RepID=A0A9X2TFE5_9BACT|nr:carbamoyl-phosphate synthase large subunit [Salinibacter ruber]MCS3660595.1 carbamoyl-phosphate synthase large subunit [Salinibacter ruber]MCS3710395.1 carbamoyl-phosphate synthase large subunit [Salinibacter ruber]MCS4115726.1 carbamoyl-phosphate synthase large subunit [Salinibacter ruber]MCS4180757.1 carbamoyl-phosphate synthase large subunit [Salinibacter ruber]
MPKRTDIETILLIGSGPIVIGQACEFDYSGSQSARALMDEGYRVVLVNSNPATIMTDPLMADEVYLRPLTPSSIAQIAREEEPDAVLPTMGGQTGLNVAQDLKKDGFWDEEDIDVIGVDIDTVQITEDRQEFRTLMDDIGLDQSRSDTAKSLLEAKEITQELGGLPVVIRPSYTLGGSGGGIVWKEDEFEEMVTRGLELSPAHQVLIDECLFGWKEYELELLRDPNDNVIIIASIENVTPMGVHTGDSVTVAPQQTLTDKQFQRMRDAAIKAMNSIGTFAGGCNIQFAFEPGTGRMIVIEINPRVSRSSALASKATGYPIAKVASKLAIGYTLDELPNEVTGDTSACFEPSLDYVVTKIPRFNFDKFEGVDEELTTQMKAVGEVMSIGRTFNESLQKAWQSLEIGYAGLGADRPDADRETVRERLTAPRWDNLLHVRHAFRYGASVEEVHDITQIDKWFLYQIKDLVALEEAVRSTPLREMDALFLREVKRAGFSDEQIAFLVPEDVTDREVRAHRTDEDVTPAYQLVDTCAGEFPAETPYYYSSYETVNESTVTDRPKVLILGSGPNRIGQGIEFDYCCVHGVKAAQEMGYEALMLNCNPETVSTDFDVADKLYFEPVFWERVQDVIDLEQPEGVILQLGGQTAIKLGERFEEDGIQVLGTSYSKMDLVEDRGKFTSILQKLDIPFPPYGVAHSVEEALETAGRLGYPTLIRPSYVLGGEGMRIAINEDEVAEYVGNVLETYPDNEILLDRFLEDAVELDVDAICDGDEVWIAGMMQHIEPAGVHSGDSTAVLPPFSLSDEVLETIREYVRALAFELDVLGLVNVQLIVKDGTVYVIEANPRASRTVPFIAKAAGIPIPAIATKVMLGETLETFRERGDLQSDLEEYAIKEPVFSWDKFPEVPKELGPEMKSTGESIAFVESLDAEQFEQPYEMKDLYLSR